MLLNNSQLSVTTEHLDIEIKFPCFQVLNEKNFNKTIFASESRTVVFFNDVEEDDPELDQYECFLQVYLYYYLSKNISAAHLFVKIKFN